MASSGGVRGATASSALLLAVLSVLAAYATARPGVAFHPCNTVFITYAISTTDTALPGGHRVSGSVSIYQIVTPVRTFHADSHPGNLPPRREVAPAEPAVFGFGSLRDRAKDILAVVVGLFFGVGSGAVAAAAMYLLWTFFAHRYEICDSNSFIDDEDDEVESPKKAGYVIVPTAEQKSIKEGYEDI